MAPALLETITVGRVRELSSIVDALRAAATSDARSHILVIGPRGSGKSHLLTLAANRARNEPDLAERLRVVQLPEDDYSILGYRDLLVAALHELGDEVDPSTEPDVLEAALLAVLGDHVLVLFVENTNVVMDRLGEDGQRRLRAFLHNHQKLVLVASTPALFAAVADHDKPLYGSFQPIHLTELSPDEGRELLLQVARHDGDDDLGSFIAGETGRARLQVVSDLAGGSPRLWLLLAGCMTVDLLDELVPLFVTLLDELTPYYKARLDELAPVQAKIVTTMARGLSGTAAPGGAMTVTEIAGAAALAHSTVSKQIRELESLGFVRARKLPDRDQRATYYDLREPLLRHALDIKRTQGEPLEVIVSLLRSWHDPHVLRRAMVDVPPGQAEDYLAHALAPPREMPADALYQDGSVEDLIISARTALNVPTCRGALAVEAYVVALAVGLAATGEAPDDAVDAATHTEGLPPDLAALTRTAVEAPGTGSPEELAARMLDTVADRAKSLAAAPDLVASLLLLAGGFRLAIGDAEDAKAHLLRCPLDGVSERVALAVRAELAFIEINNGDLATAQRLVREVLDERTDRLGPDHPDTLTSRSNEANVLRAMGRHAEACDLFATLIDDRTRALGSNHLHTLSARHNHAYQVGITGDHTTSRDLFAALIDDSTRVLGPDHPDTFASRHNHAYQASEAGDHTTARDLFAALIDDRTRIFGPDHPGTLISRNSAAYLAGHAGDHATARDLYATLVDDRTRILGPNHPGVLTTRHNHAYEVGATGDHATARDLYTTLVDDSTRALGPDHPDTLTTRHEHARQTGLTGGHTTARDLYTTLIDDRTRILGPDHPHTFATRHEHAYQTGLTGDHTTARDLYTTLIDDRTRILGPNHPGVLTTRHNHAYEVGATGDHATARDLYTTLVDDSTRALGPDHPDTLTTRHRRGMAMMRSADEGGIEVALEALERMAVLRPGSHLAVAASATLDAARVGARIDRSQTHRLIRAVASAPQEKRTAVVTGALRTGDWDGVRDALVDEAYAELRATITAVLDAAEALLAGDEGALARLGPELQPLVQDLVERRQGAEG